MPSSTRRVRFVALAGVCCVALAAGGVMFLAFKPDVLRPSLAAEVQRLTGRELRLGHLGFDLLPSPTLVASDVALANMAGGSRPAMITVPRLSARIAFWPLLRGRFEITRLTLHKPDVLLETSPGGRGNRRLGADQPSAPLPRAEETRPQNAENPPPVQIALQQLLITDGHIAWRDTRTGRSVTAIVPRLDAAIESGHLTLSGQWRLKGDSQTKPASAAGPQGRLHLVTGPFSGALGAQQGIPWPLTLDLAADLNTLWRGLRVDAAHLVLGGMDRPIQVESRGVANAAEWRVAGTLATPRSLFGGAWRFALNAQLGGGTMTAQGVLNRPAALAGLSAQISAQFSDLSTLSPLVQRPLPPLRDMRLAGLVSDQNGLANGFLLHGMHLSMPGMDLSGTVGLVKAAGRPMVQAMLTARQIDLSAVFRQDWAPTLAPTLAPVTGASPSADAGPGISPNHPLALDLLRAVDADLQMQVARLVVAGVTGQDAVAHLTLHDGQLRVDPLAMDIPAGLVAGGLVGELQASPPRLGGLLRATGLQLDKLLPMFGIPSDASGALGIDASFTGRGESLHQLAAHGSGHVGLWLDQGTLGEAILHALAAHLPRGLRQTLLPTAGGPIRVQCLAVRAEARNGQVAFPALLLESSRLELAGGGQIDLGAETLALRLRPSLWSGLGGMVMTARVDGDWSHPAIVLGQPAQEQRVPEAGGMPDGNRTDTACPAQLAVAQGQSPSANAP